MGEGERPPFEGPFPRDGKGAVVTVGTFDGVHRGHWAVLQEIQRRAESADRRSVLVTFDPHPLQVLRPEIAPALLTTPAEKKEILAESGVDYALFLHFTPALSRYSPERFVREILVEGLGVRELVIGYDHGFGRGRSGDAETLRTLGRALGFEVDVVAPVVVDDAGRGAVSSSRIRDALARGDLRAARAWLGRPYSVRGTVIRGEGRGRELGVPTANLRVAGRSKLLPPSGIYAAYAQLGSGPGPRTAGGSGLLAGAVHLGPRPTFPGSPPALEVHLLDFEGDLYGRELRLDFVERLRPVEPFGSIQALVEQMHRDVEATRELLASDSGYPRAGP